MKNFQIAVLVIFVFAAIAGVLVFSGIIPLGGGSENTGQGTVVLWGTENSSVILPLLGVFNEANETFVLQYVQKSPETFDQEMLEALASGQGPDLFFLTDEMALSYRNKIFTIPYASYPLASFKNNFVGAGEVFATSSGVMAYPITVDPLVMYYDRAVLEANNIIYPPVYWDEFDALIPLLTKKDEAGRIMKSTVALGQYVNVANAKDLLAALFMQTGNGIVAENSAGTFESVLDDYTGSYGPREALEFYTDFTDPLSSRYSWNRSFPNSREAFSGGDLAFYFGYASELGPLVNANPNQDFFIAPLPQIRGASFKLTGSKVTGIAVLSSSKNFSTAYIAANLLSSGEFASGLSASLGVPPARRDLLVTPPEDAYSPAFYSSALYARSWLDPSPQNTGEIFRTMVDGVLSNVSSVSDAIMNAANKLSLLLINK